MLMEDRNCNCINNDMVMKMEMSMNDYNCDDKEMTRAEMLKMIKCYRFAVIELALVSSG